MTKNRHIHAPRIAWSPEQKSILISRYANEKTETIAAELGIPLAKVYAMASRCGLKKSTEFLASPAAGRTNGKQGTGTRFAKGHTTWNKGMKGLDLAGERGKATQFKKGHRGGKAAELYKPIGTERISKDGYLQRKVNDAMPLQKRWRGVHIIVWEEVNGPLPKGHSVTFKDGDKQNVAIENLELVTRAALMKRNTIHNYPKEIALLVQLRAALQRKINRRLKDERQAEE